MNSGENLTSEQRQQLETLINKYEDGFASNKKNTCEEPEHKIITRNVLPVKQKPHRIPEAWQEEVNCQVQAMLHNQVICPSSSPWNAPIILAKKMDNSMCVSYVNPKESMLSRRKTITLSHICAM